MLALKENSRPIGIGIGASAGGLEALEVLFENLPESLQKKVCFVVAQHLSPSHRSLLVQILSKASNFPVVEAKNNKLLEAGVVYITPPDSDIIIKKGYIYLSKPINKSGPKPSVDKLFASLAEEYQEKSLAIVLSGTGTDGSEGVIKIKEFGGQCIAQHPKQAKYDGMPSAAIRTGCVGFQCYPELIGRKIEEILNLKKSLSKKSTKATELSDIFREIQNEFGIDFNQYKINTIQRRIEKRMLFLNISKYQDYRKLISENKEERNSLFQSFLIGVTSFYRDTESFKNLEIEIEKRIKNEEIGDEFRVWVPGCSTGEEAYGICMIIDYLFNKKYQIRTNIQVFATDISDAALLIGRKGVYDNSIIDKIPLELIQEYVIHKESNFIINKSIRSKILFSHHDLTSNPPFLKIDLISCRNLLIYFNLNVQKRIFPIFHYSLKEKGILFLGKSESIVSVEDMFEILNSKSKIYKKRSVGHKRQIKFSAFSPLRSIELNNDVILTKQEKIKSHQVYLKERVLKFLEPTYLVVSENFDILESSGKVGDILEISAGNMEMNLSRLMKKSLLIEVKNLVLQAIKSSEKQSCILKNISIDDKLYNFRISAGLLTADALYENRNTVVLVFEKFESQKIVKSNSKALDTLNIQKFVELEQELDITKNHLQSYIDEIESTNQELQSLNEEMQSSNEELQSSIEELETSNEELQASNEELQTAYSEIKHINHELEVKEKELNESNSLFYSLFENSPQGNILVDASLIIKLFNEPARGIANQIGFGYLEQKRNFLEIIGKHQEFEKILNLVRKVQSEKVSCSENVQTNLLNETYHSEIHIAPILLDGNIQHLNIGLRDLSELLKKEEELFERDEMLNSLLESNTTFLIRLDLAGNYTYVNESFCQKFGYNAKDVIGKSFLPTVHPDDLHECDKIGKKILLEPHLVHKSFIRKPNPKGGYFDTEWEYVAIQNNEGSIMEIQGVGRDISEQRRAVIELEEERNYLEMLIWGGRLGTWDWDLLSNEIQFNERWAEMMGIGNGQLKYSYGHWEEFVFHADLPKVREALNSVIREERAFYDIDYRCIDAGGKLIWIHSTGKVIGKNKKNKPIRIVGIHQDITEKRDTESRLRMTEDRNNAIVSTLNEGLIIQNLEGEVISSNASAEKLLGLSFDQITGKASGNLNWKMITEDGRIFPESEQPAKMAIKMGSPQSNKIMGVVKPNGELTWLNIYAQLLYHADSEIPYAVFSILHDITASKNAEEELEESKNLLAQTGKIAKIGGWEFDFILNQLKWTEETFSIHNFHGIIPPDEDDAMLFFSEDSRPILLEAYNKVIEKGTPFDLELKLNPKDENEKWVRVIGSGKYENDQLVKIIGSIQDITESKTAKQSLKLKNEQLENINKELEQFVYIATHDLQEPLLSIRNCAEILKLEASDALDDESKKYLDFIFQSSDRLKGLIKDLMQYSRLGKDRNIEKVNVQNLLNEISKDLHFSIEESSAIISYENLPVIDAYPTELRLLFQNLLSNALKFKNKTIQPIIRIDFYESIENWTFTVEDNGIGVEKENLEKIFIIFKRLHNRKDYEGTGIGLAHCKKIIDLHGGKIWMESEKGVGSKMFFTIPKNL